MPLLIAALMFLALSSCGAFSEKRGPYDTDPLEPEQALQSFDLVSGFRAELFAAEPNIVDPVEIAFDENGVAYVAEMLDYPFDPPEGTTPRGRIRKLEDTNGDGVADRFTIFADNLLQPTSVLPWQGGLFVTSAPDILYLKDTGGDGKADVREVVFTGFEGRTVSSESRVTNLRYGLDNWIYAANNGRPGLIQSLRDPGQPPVSVRGFDFRFHPGKGLIEPAGGPTQFGMSFDEWGNRFVTENTVHLRHVVLPARYLLRQPLLAPPSMLQYVPEDNPQASVIYPLTKPQQWRIARTEVRQQRYEETQPGRRELLAGHFTAATGATVYVGDNFPDQYRGNVFVADANGNLVHLDVLHPSGATFRAERQPDDREFLASTDVWFRPVNFANAPDGNLYVVDFYREYIEEPASIPETIKQELQLDFFRGNDRGRIYRIVPANPKHGRGLHPGLGQASLEELVKNLAHADGWRRLTAQRLIVERQADEAVPLLKALYHESASPLGRLHALWTLEGLSALDPGLVAAGLKDENPRVRANALRLAEAFLPEMRSEVLGLLRDPDPEVQYQLLLTLGEIEKNERALATLLAEHAEDPWFRTAALVSVRQPLKLLTRLVTGHSGFFDASALLSAPQGEPADSQPATTEQPSVAGRQHFLRRLAALVGARRDQQEITMFLVTLGGSVLLRPPAWRAPLLAGLADGLALDAPQKLRISMAESLFTRFLTDSSEEVHDAALDASQYFELPALTRDALRAASSDEISIERRVHAIRFLRAGRFERVRPVLQKILESPSPQQVRAAAIASADVFEDPAVAEVLLAGWRGYGPEVRGHALQALLRYRERTRALLEAVEQGRVPASSIDPVTRIRLRQYPDQNLQPLAERLFQDDFQERRAVVEAFRDVVELPGDPARGRVIFDENCASCHLQRGERGRIGPDLSGVNNKSKEELLGHVLDPSFSIEPRYTNYIVIDRDGRLYDGLLVGETTSAVTLRGEREDVTILRKNVAEMRASEVSLMPEGFEQDLSREQLADVIAYLRAGL